MVTIPHLLVDVCRMLAPYPHPRPSKRGEARGLACAFGIGGHCVTAVRGGAETEVETSSGHGLLSPKGANAKTLVYQRLLRILRWWRWERLGDMCIQCVYRQLEVSVTPARAPVSACDGSLP